MKLFSKKKKCIICGKGKKTLCTDCQVIQDRRADKSDDLLKEFQCPVCNSVPLVLRKGMYDEYHAMVKELEELRKKDL